MIDRCSLAKNFAMIKSGLLALIAGSFLFAGNAHAVLVKTAFTDNVTTGATSYAIASAGNREAYAEAIGACDSSIAGCAAAASGFASTSYDVGVGASAAFYDATGLSVGDLFFIPLNLTYSLIADGNADASVSFNGSTTTAVRQEKSGTNTFLLRPGQAVNVRLTARANSNASTFPGPFVQESFAWADPVASIDSTWEWAAYAGLISITELLDPVESIESGLRPNGYSPKLPPGSALLPAVPVPAAVWLFSTALIGLAGFSKRRKAV